MATQSQKLAVEIADFCVEWSQGGAQHGPFETTFVRGEDATYGDLLEEYFAAEQLENPPLCHRCNGSGVGSHPDSGDRCPICNGSGVIKPRIEEDECGFEVLDSSCE